MAIRSDPINIISPVAAIAVGIPITANPSPEEGTLYFDIATGKLYIYNGTDWKFVQLGS